MIRKLCIAIYHWFVVSCFMAVTWFMYVTTH
jgi:hypothetical protein